MSAAYDELAFVPGDRVRVVRLLVAEREVTGASANPPQPRVGDHATVVADVGDGLVLVESCTDDGMTVWMTEMAIAELTLVDRADG